MGRALESSDLGSRCQASCTFCWQDDLGQASAPQCQFPCVPLWYLACVGCFLGLAWIAEALDR